MKDDKSSEESELEQRMEARMQADLEARMREKSGVDEPVLNPDGSPWSYNFDMGDDPVDQMRAEDYYSNDD